ncbi:MAG: alpha/beta hydrolase [Actinomycetia bacterium]|nr:alpha/beta hydrolase [Actinomycetes bacterium]
MLVPVDGHHLRTVDVGRGTPLLLHDGWVASWDLWLPLIELLQHDWRCLALDHRGTGASTFPAEAIARQSLVDDVFRVLDAHQVGRCVVAGESLGSLVVLQAVLQDPSRFEGLVLVGGFPRTLPVSPSTGEAVLADWPGYVDSFVSACLPEPDAGPLHRWGVQTLLPAGPEAAVRMTAVHAGVAPDLAAVPVPTLVVHGALDAIAPLAGAHELAAAIPDARLVVLDDAGHVPILTRPRQVADAVTAWWSDVLAAQDTQLPRQSRVELPPEGPSAP